MKKLTLFFCFILIGFYSKAQSPKFDGRFLPVPGITIKQVWDTTATQLMVPKGGPSNIWDYANKFTSIADTFEIKTVRPDSSIPGSGNIVKLVTNSRSPFPELDSVDNYYAVTRNGFYLVGGYYEKVELDTLFKHNIKELILPFKIGPGDAEKNASSQFTYFTYNGYDMERIRTKVKRFKNAGHGILVTPLDAFKNVILEKEMVCETDSFFIKSGSSYTFDSLVLPVTTTNYCLYHFLRNNTFGSPELMLLQGDTAGTSIQYGWYMLPSDIASIQGAITDSLGNPVTAGKVSLFRANSNFPQHDMLASVSLDSTGTYQFDSIPYGTYRIAVKPDTSIYSTAIITYYGNKAKWKNAEVLLLSQDTSGINIELKYRKPLNGSGSLNGNISIDSSGSGKMKASTSEPSEGTHIMVVDNVGSVIIDGDSNIDGDFTFENLADGDYELFVDVPGLEMSQTYSFSIVGNTIVSDLDFIIGEDSIYASSSAVVTRVNTNSTILITNLSAYPNPCKEYTTLNVTLAQKDVVTLEVFDALGNLIYTIAHEEHSSGQYSYKISFKDLGEKSGAFVVRLTTYDKCISQIIIKN